MTQLSSLDLRSSLLTLDNVQASLSLFSLTRSLHLSPFTLIVPVVATVAARVASVVTATAGAAVLGAAVLRRSVVP